MTMLVQCCSSAVVPTADSDTTFTCKLWTMLVSITAGGIQIDLDQQRCS